MCNTPLGDLNELIAADLVLLAGAVDDDDQLLHWIKVGFKRKQGTYDPST